MEFGVAVGAQITAVRRGVQIGVGGDGVAALVAGGRAVRVWTVMRGRIEVRRTEVAAAAGFGVAAVPVGPGSAQTAKAAIDGDRASMTVAGCGDARIPLRGRPADDSKRNPFAGPPSHERYLTEVSEQHPNPLREAGNTVLRSVMRSAVGHEKCLWSKLSGVAIELSGNGRQG